MVQLSKPFQKQSEIFLYQVKVVLDLLCWISFVIYSFQTTNAETLECFASGIAMLNCLHDQSNVSSLDQTLLNYNVEAAVKTVLKHIIVQRQKWSNN